MSNKFKELFKIEKPIIGMIHLAGDNVNEIRKRALEELIIYQEEGVNVAIIEDYHGPPEEISEILRLASKENLNLILGVNHLRNPYFSFYSNNLGAKFLQFDSVQNKDLHLVSYNNLRINNPDLVVFGGIRFKYTHPTGNSLERDLDEGKSNCDGIVTTGEGTGIETPLEKLKQFKDYLKDFPLIVGAGVTLTNVSEQLIYADGAIVGSYFKRFCNTKNPVERSKVRDFMHAVKKLRN